MAYLDDLQVSINNITTSSQNIEFVILATQITTATNSRCLSVPDVNSLPVLTTSTNYPEGQIIFVESVGVPVISAQNKWIGLDGRTLRKDFISRELWTWGSNSGGVLGHGNTITRRYPTREISRSVNWNTISDGGIQCQNAGIKNNGELWSWGCNSVGGLADGTTFNRCSPVREFCSATDWCQVSTGGFSHTLAIKTSGQMWGWGANTHGVLGIGNSATIGRCSPVREFCSATDWCQVSLGCATAAVIKTSGQLWTIGWNPSGVLGIGNSATIGRCSPVREFCSATDWCQVSVSCFFMGAIKTSGQLWTWGNNTYGQLGIGNSATIGRCSPVREFCSATDWCKISAGVNHFVAIKTTGQIWSWGRNLCAVLGTGNTVTTNVCSPIREFCSATDWCKVSAGYRHVAAIKTTGELWAWGCNLTGELGNGSTALADKPVREGFGDTRWCDVFGGRAFTSALKIT